MRAGHRPNPFALAAFLAALGPAALRKAERIERPLAFDPLALLRRPPRKERQRYGSGAHCGAKQAAKYARQTSAESFNVHWSARMRWNKAVYPRVIEHQVRQRERR